MVSLPFKIKTIAKPVVAVLRLSGVIHNGTRATLNDETIAPIVNKVFKKQKPAAVALLINCPGGSPVQSSLIAARIKDLADETNIPVYAFVEDVAASGGYWLALAAKEIWIDANSIVGSIGVVSAGFGFDQMMEKHGIERRLYTAGKSKSMLDPFSPVKTDDVKRLQILQQRIHENFIAHVKSNRQNKLDTEQDLFSGDVWIGSDAVNAGLVDGLGHLTPKMKDLFGDKVKFKFYSTRRPFMQRLGMHLLQGVSAEIIEQSARAKYNL